MKYCRLGAVNVNGSVVGNSCVPTFQFDPAGGTNVMRDRAAFETRRPHERRGHVQVRVRRVDGHVGAVGVVAEDLVDEPHGAVVPGDVPARPRPDACSVSFCPAPSNASTEKMFFANSCTA